MSPFFLDAVQAFGIKSDEDEKCWDGCYVEKHEDCNSASNKQADCLMPSIKTLNIGQLGGQSRLSCNFD